MIAELCALSNVVDHGLRAALVDMKRTVQRPTMGGDGVCIDGTCLVHTLRKSVLALGFTQHDLSALKQLSRVHRNHCDEHVDGSKGDFLRWMDTPTMLSECHRTGWS